MLSPPDIFYSPIRSPPDIFYSPIRFTEMLHHYAYSMTSPVSAPKIHIFQERIQLWNGKGSQCFLHSTNFSTYTTCYVLQERTALNTHTRTHTHTHTHTHAHTHTRTRTRTRDIYILPKWAVPAPNDLIMKHWSMWWLVVWWTSTDISEITAASIFMMKKFSNLNVEGRGFSERSVLTHGPLFLFFFYVLLTVHLSIILVTDQLNAQILVL